MSVDMDSFKSLKMDITVAPTRTLNTNLSLLTCTRSVTIGEVLGRVLCSSLTIICHGTCDFKCLGDMCGGIWRFLGL